jgi:hypothetical protein
VVILKVTKENIDDLIEEWHKSPSNIALHDYLGWTIEEYFHWAKTNEMPNK